MIEAGTQLGQYKIVRKLGSGGMADVYEAEDQRLKRRVALKVLPHEFTRNPDLVRRFETEVLAAAGLNHRSIVTVYEVGQQDGVHFYSMRMLMGGDLRRRIEAGLKPIESLAILRELTGAFDHAHGKNFVHRDVKPENVLFDDEGLPVLTDFGIAKALGVGSDLTGTGNAIGTPRYLSPEQARGKPVDARSDLYSLGVMLYEMLVGRPPYDGEDSVSIILKHVSDPIPQLPAEHAMYQPLVDQLMAKKADERIPTAKELRRRIDALQPRWASGNTLPPGNQTLANPAVQRLLTPSPLNPGATVASAAVTTGTRTTNARGVAKILKQAAQERAPDLAAAAVPAAVSNQPEEDDTARSGAAPSPRFMKLVVPVGAAMGALLVAAVVWMVLPGDKATETAVPADAAALPAPTEIAPAAITAAPTVAPDASVVEPGDRQARSRKRKLAGGPEPADTAPAMGASLKNVPSSQSPTPQQPVGLQSEPQPAADIRRDPEPRGLRMEQMIRRPAGTSSASAPAASAPPPTTSTPPASRPAAAASAPPASRPAAAAHPVDEEDPLVVRQREMEEQRRKKLEAEQKAAAQAEQEDEFLRERALQLQQERARKEEARRKKEQEEALRKKQEEEAQKPAAPGAAAPTAQPPGG